MNKLAYKLVASAMSAGLILGTFVTSAFAANLEITDNGASSSNSIVVTNSGTCTVSQKANTNVEAMVGASSNTGGNTANRNTGGAVSITTGDADATATITVTGGENTATNPCCCTLSNEPPTTEISGNGDSSTNNVVLTETKSKTVRQRARTRVSALVGARARTGRNSVRGNTGTGTTISTGLSSTTSDLTVTGGVNTLD